MGRFSDIPRLFLDIATCTRGNVATIFALSLPLVIGAGAFGVETTYLYYKQNELQASADGAAHAGAIELRSGGDFERVVEVAFLVARENGFTGPVEAVEVHTPPTTGTHVGDDAVEVILPATAQRFFTAVFFEDDVDLSARAVAEYQTASNACVLALDTTGGRAIQFSGNTTARFTGCSIMANSTAADAVNVQGSARLEATCVISGGGVASNSGITLTECDSLILHAPAVADPFRDLVQPTVSGPCQSSAGAVLSPGRFCGGLRLSGDVKLSPGVYMVSGGDFRVNANARVSGEGVTIFLDANAQTHFNGTATIELSAPKSGPYAGVLFFGDRESSGSSVFNGTAMSRLTGAIYMPSRTVSYLGNYSGQDGCTQVVAGRIEWSGSTAVSVDCSSRGLRSLPVLSIVRLVE